MPPVRRGRVTRGQTSVPEDVSTPVQVLCYSLKSLVNKPIRDETPPSQEAAAQQGPGNGLKPAGPPPHSALQLWDMCV